MEEKWFHEEDVEQESAIIDDEPLLGQISFDELLSELRLNWAPSNSLNLKAMIPLEVLASRGFCFIYE